MLNILKLSCLKYWWNIKNNKIKLIIVILFNTILLLIFFLGMKSEDAMETLGIDYATIFIIYIIIWIIMSSFSKMSELITTENKEGTLEILYTSPYGFIKILFSNIIINIFICVLLLLLLFILNNSITGILNNANFFQLTFVITIGMFSLYGIGLIIAGITLLTKEIDMILFVVKIVAAYLIMTYDSIFIPFTEAKNLITDIILNGSIDQSKIGPSILTLILNSLLYFILGVIVYKVIEKQALKRGSIGN